MNELGKKEGVNSALSQETPMYPSPRDLKPDAGHRLRTCSPYQSFKTIPPENDILNKLIDPSEKAHKDITQLLNDPSKRLGISLLLKALYNAMRKGDIKPLLESVMLYHYNSICPNNYGKPNSFKIHLDGASRASEEITVLLHQERTRIPVASVIDLLYKEALKKRDNPETLY